MAATPIPKPSGDNAWHNGGLDSKFLGKLVDGINSARTWEVHSTNESTAKIESSDEKMMLSLPNSLTLPPYPEDDFLYVLGVQSGVLLWVVTTTC